MLIAITADLHLNNSTYGILAEDGLPVKTSDAINGLRFIASQCIEMSVDMLVIAGDIFENHFPSSVIREIFNHEMQRIVDHGIEVVIMIGNHDICRDHHALMPVTGWTNRVRVVDTVTHEKHDGIVFSFIPHTFDIEHRKTSFATIVNALVDSLGSRTSDTPYLVFGHFPVSGAMTNDALKNRSKEDVALDALKLLRPTACFLGHYHKPQVMNKKHNIMYVGSVERRNFSEQDHDKGFVVYDTGTNKHSFVEYEGARNMTTVSCNSMDDAVILLESLDLSGHLVKLLYGGNRDGWCTIRERMPTLRKIAMKSGAYLVAADGMIDEEEITDEVRKRIRNGADVLTIIEEKVKIDCQGRDDSEDVLKMFSEISKEVNGLKASKE